MALAQEYPVIKINYPGSGNYSQFSFDGTGKNIKIVEQSGGTTTSTKQFIWSGAHRAEARDASSNLISQYFKTGQTLSGINYFYTKDHLGSVSSLTDTAGNIQAQYSYDPYGKGVRSLGTLSPDFQYAGYYFHAPSGLSLTLTRAYSAPLGRWINRDTVAELGGVNLFNYAANAPTEFTDPSGEAVVVIIIIIIIIPFITGCSPRGGSTGSGEAPGGNTGGGQTGSQPPVTIGSPTDGTLPPPSGGGEIGVPPLPAGIPPNVRFFYDNRNRLSFRYDGHTWYFDGRSWHRDDGRGQYNDNKSDPNNGGMQVPSINRQQQNSQNTNYGEKDPNNDYGFRGINGSQ